MTFWTAKSRTWWDYCTILTMDRKVNFLPFCTLSARQNWLRPRRYWKNFELSIHGVNFFLEKIVFYVNFFVSLYLTSSFFIQVFFFGTSSGKDLWTRLEYSLFFKANHGVMKLTTNFTRIVLFKFLIDYSLISYIWYPIDM